MERGGRGANSWLVKGISVLNMFKFICVYVLWFLFCQFNGSAKADVEPVLRPNEQVLETIRRLKPNTWKKLPPVRTAGDLTWLRKYNYERMRTQGPLGRDYSGKMVWMPDRKRAIYAGGGHNIRPFNDVWEYDLPSNTWVCLYAPDPPLGNVNWEQSTIIKDGVLQHKRSGPPRLSHTFDAWNYDTNRCLAFLPESLRGAVFVSFDSVSKILALRKEELRRQWKPGPYFITFDPYQRRWQYITKNVPKCGRDPSARYISHLDQYWVNSTECALYNPVTGSKKRLSMKNRGGG